MKLYACFLKDSTPQIQHEAAHRLLRFALKKEYGIEEYVLGKGSHGKPFLISHSDIGVNLSHCKGMAVCGVGKTSIGVDCEGIRSVRDRVIKRVCIPSEANEIESSENPELTFTRFWTLKESFVKAVGRGISYPMKNAAFSLADNVIYTNVTSAGFWQYVLFDRYVISVCAAKPENECALEILSENI